jgi:hypothetical protein
MRHQAGSAEITGYAFFKYGFIFIIVCVVLWFITRYILPLFSS